ncbi:MAG: double zinc ribbon domain-containing protein, partial [Anaerolineae bacterium]
MNAARSGTDTYPVDRAGGGARRQIRSWEESVIDPVRSAWSIRRWLLDLVLPPRCAGCDRVGVWLCESCAQQFLPFEGPLCPRCGRPRMKPTLCPVCAETPLKANPIRSTFLFEGPLRDALHAFKYRG